jgi:gamma-glutamyltranspeptidase/glutathione hydrolase
VPGTGLLASCVPGAFDGWLTLLREFGTLRLEDVLRYAIGYARDGYPVVPGITLTIERTASLLREWPASAELYLPAPRAGSLFRNEALASTYERVVQESRGGSREQELDRARDLFYGGFVAEEIHRFSAAEGGLLTGDDLVRWRATLETPVTYDFRGRTVCKAGPWSQAPVLLQQLALLDGFPLEELDDAERVHVITECAKLAFADREAFYGDVDDVPLDRLLSREYNDERRTLVSDSASRELRPGGGRLPDFVAQSHKVEAAVGAGEPTRGDTVHLDVVDRLGNFVSATPSGGWLQSSPVIRSLGWPLGTRAQMFWLEEGLPSSLAPGKRPRTTLSPTLVLRNGEPELVLGTPGGDQQDQWTLHAFLNHAVLGMNLQEAIDAPEHHTDHFPSSFHPRDSRPASLAIEGRFLEETVAELRERGHDVTVLDDWSLGRVTAAGRAADGQLKAAANPRGMQGYAAGR